MDYYDLIEYLAERLWFEKMLSRTPITSTVKLFMAALCDIVVKRAPP